MFAFRLVGPLGMRDGMICSNDEVAWVQCGHTVRIERIRIQQFLELLRLLIRTCFADAPWFKESCLCVELMKRACARMVSSVKRRQHLATECILLFAALA